MQHRRDVTPALSAGGPGSGGRGAGRRARAALARREATIALQLLAERMPGLRRAGAVRRRNATTARGPIRLPVAVGARRLRNAAPPAGA